MVDVKRLVEIINKEGRQGPRDLKSQEVYNWVYDKIGITYDQYMQILDDNAIVAKDRMTNRNAFFVIEDDGKYQLFKSKEDEIRKYICYIVRENPQITSGEARQKVKYLYKDYTIVDLMEQKNLTSNQDIIDQTIRNIMVSNYSKHKNYILFNRSESKPYTYTLKKAGFELSKEVDKILSDNKMIDLIQDEEDSINYIKISKDIGVYSEDELKIIHQENEKYNYCDEFKTKISGRTPTDPKIKATRFKQTRFKCEVDEQHKTFQTPQYPSYMEGHHIVPISRQRNFSSIKLDCIENIVSLCPICHSQIHYGTREAKFEIFNCIVKKRNKDLESIGFTEEQLKNVFDLYY